MFDTFVNTLIAAAIKHEWMQTELAAAGIKLADLPDRLIGKPTWLAYQSKRKTMGHQSAAFELERDTELLERFADSLTSIPRNPEVLRDKFQRLFEEYQFQLLADRLAASPEAGRDLIKEFQLKEALAVQHQTVAELSMLVEHQHIQAKEQKSVLSVCGFEKLSHMIGGFNPERLGIFLGGTGFGKTNFAVNLSLSAAQTMHVAYVNMEMGYADMVKRFAVIGARVPYTDYASGNFHPGEVISELKRVGGNIHLTSGRTLSFDQIAAWIRMLHNQTPVNLAIVDYDQKVDLNLKHQTEEWKALQKLIEAFEELAKELQLYVLVLAQVNREGLISGSHRAMFPAHTVLAFHEHETHGPVIEAKKNRHGKPRQAIRVLYDEKTSHISEIDKITIDKETKKERHTLQPKSKGDTWWNKG